MDSHTVGTRKAPHTWVAVLALVLVIAATMLAIQARSIWSTTTTPSVPTRVSEAVAHAPLDTGRFAQGNTHQDALEAIKSRKGH